MKNDNRVKAERLIGQSSNGWNDLANAIILQAVEDYQEAWRRIWRFKAAAKKRWFVREDPTLMAKSDLKKYNTWVRSVLRKRIDKSSKGLDFSDYIGFLEHRHKQDREMVEECKEFFRGDWIEQLTDLDGAEIEQRLYQMMLAERIRKK